MGVKYRCDYKNYFNNQCRIDISLDSYSGLPIAVRGVGDQACVISREVGDDPYDPIVSTTAAISIYQEDVALIDIQELQNADDRQFTVQVYISGALKFSGFVVPDGLQRPVKGKPFDLTITATDGLMLLNGINYTHNNLTGGRCIINYFRQILFSSNNLGLALPIKWICSVTNDQYPLEEDLFSGSMRWSPRGEGFNDYNGNVKTCMYIIEEMLKSLQCRIAQSDGAWIIWRINDVSVGAWAYKSTPDSLDGFDIITGDSENYTKGIRWDNTSDYRAVNDDHISIINKGLKTVITKYDQDQRDNILPNGSMDIVDGTFDMPIYWGILAGDAFVQSAPSLYNQDGSSVKITTFTDLDNVFGLYPSALPIDTSILYKSVDFGFKFLIEEWAGVDVDGNIIWDTDPPFTVQVVYDDGSNTWWLNEFGFFVNTTTTITTSVTALKLMDATQVDFTKQGRLKLPEPNPIDIGQASAPNIYVYFNLQPNLKIRFDDVYFTSDNNSDVYEAEVTGSINTGKEEYNLNISSSHNGFYVSNFMTVFSNSGLEKFYSDSKITGATLTEMNSHAILRNRYKASELFEGSIYAENYSYAEIYEIESFTDKKFLPLKSSWNTETCVVSLSSVEIRNDGTGITTKHYGSNDKTALSN